MVLLYFPLTALRRISRSLFMIDGAAVVGYLTLLLLSLSLILYDPVGSPEPAFWSLHGHIVSQVTSYIWLKKNFLIQKMINFQKVQSDLQHSDTNFRDHEKGDGGKSLIFIQIINPGIFLSFPSKYILL